MGDDQINFRAVFGLLLLVIFLLWFPQGLRGAINWAHKQILNPGHVLSIPTAKNPRQSTILLPNAKCTGTTCAKPRCSVTGAGAKSVAHCSQANDCKAVTAKRGTAGVPPSCVVTPQAKKTPTASKTKT